MHGFEVGDRRGESAAVIVSVQAGTGMTISTMAAIVGGGLDIDDDVNVGVCVGMCRQRIVAMANVQDAAAARAP